MERKIGEIFEYNGDWYQCVEEPQTNSCDQCILYEATGPCAHKFGKCRKSERNDNKGVIFKKLEKVGEPYMSDGHLMQTLSGYTQPIYFQTKGRECYFSGCYLRVEIKQTKEDMEEKKLNLKAFDLQKAKQGKPVCTRDGRKARIICFDRKSETPITVLVTEINGIEAVYSYPNSGIWDSPENTNGCDLMMLPETHEGWVNVYKGGLLDTKSYNTRKEAFDKACPKDYVDTVKISWYE